MSRGRNKTPAERALEVICVLADVPYEDFCKVLEQSQGERCTPRPCPESSYDMVGKRYFRNALHQFPPRELWLKVLEHVKSPKIDFGVEK